MKLVNPVRDCYTLAILRCLYQHVDLAINRRVNLINLINDTNSNPTNEELENES